MSKIILENGIVYRPGEGCYREVEIAMERIKKNERVAE